MFTTKEKYLLWASGFISGFNLIVGGYLLNFWLTSEGIDLHYIGLFTITTLPYALNFLWAPIFDRYKIPVITSRFGPRISWALLLQICLAACVLLIGNITPNSNFILFAVLSTCICFFASATDTIFGALRTEAIKPNMQGPAAGIYIFGYRVGMLIVSTLPVTLSSIIPVGVIYQYIGLIILLFPLIIILMNPKNNISKQHKSLEEQAGFGQFWRHSLGAIAPIPALCLILLFLILYRLADNFIAVMLTPFIFSLGYNELEIATIGKLSGVLGAIIGGLIGSYLMRRQSIKRSLLQFGIWHGLSHCVFIINSIIGKYHVLLFISIALESITGGMCMAAYIALISSLCTGKYRATQYSFFSSMMGLSRSILPTFSGVFVGYFGWNIFFLSMSFASAPALLMLRYINLPIISETENPTKKST